MSQTDSIQPAPAEHPAEPDEPRTRLWSPPSEDFAEQTAAETSVVAGPAQPSAGTSRLRWLVALVASVLVVGVAAAATILVVGQTAPSTVAGYVDDSTFAYVEARLDLPGDQRQRLGEFLSAFPGFDDQSILDRKLDEALDRLIGDATKGGQDWSTKIKPWFGGEIAIAVAPPDTTASGSLPHLHGLLLVKVTNADQAVAWFRDAIHVSATSESYGGTQLYRISDGDEAAFAVADATVFLLGDVDSVKKAIDSKGAGSYVRSDLYKQATAALPGNHLGLFVVDYERYLDFVSEIGGRFSATPSLSPQLRELMPAWIAGAIRADSDALVVDAVTPSIPALDAADNRPTDIFQRLPASTIFALETNDLGATIRKSLDAYRSEPSFAEPMKQVDAALSLLGGFDATLGWMKDGAIVLTRNGLSVEGGLVVSPTDPAAAQRLVTAVRGYAVLGGAQLGLKITDEDHNGTTITTIDVGDLRALGRMVGLPEASLSSLPDGRFTVVYAATDKLVIVGITDTFVKSVLDTQPDASLANSTQFKAATDRAGSAYRGLWYVDLTAVRELLENQVSDADKRTEYERDYKPYTVPFRALVVSGREDGNLNRAEAWLVVGK